MKLINNSLVLELLRSFYLRRSVIFIMVKRFKKALDICFKITKFFFKRFEHSRVSDYQNALYHDVINNTPSHNCIYKTSQRAIIIQMLQSR